MPSQSTLNTDEKNKVKAAIPTGSNKILFATLARIYYAHPQPDEWAYAGLQGALAFVMDTSKNIYSFRMVDLTGTRGVIWEYEVYSDFQYNADRAFFHSFAADECMIGFVFADEREAKTFWKKVTTKKAAKTKPASEKKKKASKGGKIDESMISGPASGSFKHVVHMGYDEDAGFTSTGVDPSWTAFLGQLQDSGISSKVIAQEMEFIKDFTKKHNTAVAAPREKKPKRLPPPSRRTHAANDSTSSSVASAPPPPRPPPRNALEEEHLVEERRVQAENERIVAEEATTALVAEQKAEEERARLEAEHIAEEQRVAAEEADRAHIAAAEAERAQLEVERVAAEEVAAVRAKQKATDNTPSVIESESNVAAQSSERMASWQTEAYIDGLLANWERRRLLLPMVTLPNADRQGLSAAQIRQRLGDIETQISTFLIHILSSQEARRAAQRLESDRAQSLVDAIQDALDRGTLPDSSSRSNARHFIQKVFEAREQLPSSLFIEGVNDHDQHPTFGGGFGDVYQASYQGRMVALKRIRIFTADSTPHRTRLQFYKEALVWQGLRHRFILSLLGIDHLTFAPSFCMVSPWMKHGTVLKYLRAHGRGDVNRLLLEIAQGLNYLHSTNVVHGDLRGNNILVSDDGNACLSDFGLATTIAEADSTVGFTSSSNRAGSVRWFAPELIDPVKFGCKKFIRTKASDVYAYACVCLELYTGDPPFSYVQDVAAMFRVIGGERPEQPPSISAAVWQVVTSAWGEDFRARPTIHDIAIALEGIP